jgi:hypothetical protein
MCRMLCAVRNAEGRKTCIVEAEMAAHSHRKVEREAGPVSQPHENQTPHPFSNRWYDIVISLEV